MTVADEIADIYLLGHSDILRSIAELSEDQLRWRPPRSNSIGFNVWHVARWADHMHSVLSTMTPGLRERIGSSEQIWARDGLSAKWGFSDRGLGAAETGMGMDEDASATLPLPPKDALVAYARAAFDAADGAMKKVQDDDLFRSADFPPGAVPWASPGEYGTVANWILSGIRHDSRHLGMIEALRGAAGLRGTATR